MTATETSFQFLRRRTRTRNRNQTQRLHNSNRTRTQILGSFPSLVELSIILRLDNSCLHVGPSLVSDKVNTLNTLDWTFSVTDDGSSTSWLDLVDEIWQVIIMRCILMTYYTTPRVFHRSDHIVGAKSSGACVRKPISSRCRACAVIPRPKIAVNSVEV